MLAIRYTGALVQVGAEEGEAERAGRARVLAFITPHGASQNPACLLVSFTIPHRAR